MRGTKVPNSWLLPHPFCSEARPPPAKPMKDSTIHQQLSLCILLHIPDPWAYPTASEDSKIGIKTQVSNKPNSRHQVHSAPESRILPGGTQQSEHSRTHDPPCLTATWDLCFERRVQWFESSSDKKHKCSYYKFGIKVKHLLRHESLSYSSLKFPQ